jgi:hypothetical protein
MEASLVKWDARRADEEDQIPIPAMPAAIDT